MNTRFANLLRLGLVTFALLFISARLAAEPLAPQIRVSGQAEVSMAPDMALLQLTVMRQADTARLALDANSSAMAEVIQAMQAGGVAERDLQTSNFSVQPRYVYPKPRNEKPPELVGYTVRNSLTVRVRDLDALGSLLDQSVSLGVNEGGNISFTNDDPSAAVTKARAKAVKDAMSRAQTLADAAGVRLGDITEISEQTHRPQPRPYRAERVAMSAAADSVPVMAGENSYQVVVHMSFAIDQ
ncbi:MAG: SIMPL domain-containing protein [Halioglobus sp.]